MSNMIEVTAKVSGYHPASGLQLVEGESYAIDESVFAADIFARKSQTTKPKIEGSE